MGWAESHADLRRITPKKPGAGPGMNRWDQLYSSTSWLPAKKAAKKAAAKEGPEATTITCTLSSETRKYGTSFQ